MVHVGKRPLKVFLCHASGDKPPVRDLYKRLTAEGVDVWLDKEKLLPGQDWRLEIPKAVKEADVVVVCLSNKSITKEGYVQKEIKFALDIAEEKPEGAIFLIPARLEDCIVPERLSRWEWVDIYEENGFVRLLRSLKLRADAVDATVEPDSYVDSDKETERKLEQLYTEGLAAFYTEEWEKACQRFQSILRERPNHKNAAEKLAEAERQRDLANLYEQAMGAVRAEDWGTAIKTLDELSQKSEDYKDTAQLLRNAKKQKQLRELYAEARTLHAAQKWQAVVKVFEQITAIDPAYPDADGLLSSAQKEVAELKRLADLNDRYSHALREMELGSWYEARRLLESVHKSQTGFLETEKLLRKVESEIEREEKKHRQNDEINTLYEQAHGLLRSKKWQNALEKLELIRKLDDHYPDSDGIADKAKKELAREEQETERQNKLAALYAEAVKLLKEEKYQEALDRWQEVKAIDSKYPDRQWVQRTAKRKLAGTPHREAEVQPRFVGRNIRIEWFILLATIGFGLARLAQQNFGLLLRVDPLGIGWGLRGVLQGLIAALVLGRVEKDWKWKALLSFAICWAIFYPIAFRVLNRQSIQLVSILLSMAPVLSIIFLSSWTKRWEQWQTYFLIFLGWILAWLIGQSTVGYLEPVIHWVPIRLALCDALAGGVGLWITVDLLHAKSRIFLTEDESTIASGNLQKPEQQFLLAFLAILIIRMIWGLFQNWFHIWDSELLTITQFLFMFVLGGCYGAVVALLMKKVAPDWKPLDSLIVISGWALGFGMAISGLKKIGLDFNAVFFTISGLSIVVVIKRVNPSTSPLKVTLIFVSWALVKTFGGMAGNYFSAIFYSDYVLCFADAVTILLGLLVSLGIYGYSTNRLVKITFITTMGFALGNYITVLLHHFLVLDYRIEMPLALAFFGLTAGAVFEMPSRNLKKIFMSGGLCAIGLEIGYFPASLLFPRDVNLQNILWGACLGVAFGLSTRRVYKIILLSILGSAIFTITSVYIVTILYSVPSFESILSRGAWIGLVMGFGYAYITRDTEITG